MSGTENENTVPPPTEARPARGLWHSIGLALSGALLLLVIALAVLLIVVPKATGGQPLTVLTSSMEPRLPPGTLIVVRPVDPSDLRIGDVVTYQIRSGQPGVITHRVIAIASASTGGRTFTLKGDNNSDPDAEQVREEQVRGRLWYSVPLIGYLNNVIGGANRAWVVPGAAVLLLAYAGYMIAGGVVGAVKNRRSPGNPDRGRL
ncbi:signal peptidase I [Cryobacterium tagatosivorans]|uniref:Signal peptidase I n=1 Tax=Cryobacterium tagatosivorans TaxID=1259199 RepID=A0A4R8UCD2_9MICO|nr:signal peptidase I [Cryobacterium tagatosivorans]TFB47233.1 signal peptidase I [Cryobacterium tagatosivorans]